MQGKGLLQRCLRHAVWESERCQAAHSWGAAQVLCWFLGVAFTSTPMYSLVFHPEGQSQVKHEEELVLFVGLCLQWTRGGPVPLSASMTESREYKARSHTCPLPHCPESRERRLLMRLGASDSSNPDSWLPLTMCHVTYMSPRPSFSPPCWLLSGSEAGSAVELLQMQ